MSIKVSRADEGEFRVAVVEPTIDEEPTIYDLQYLNYRLDLQRDYKLSDTETKIISFILSYANVRENFYFGNESLGRLFGKSVTTISLAISTLEKKGFITTTRKIMAGGGEIRFIQLSENLKQGFKKTESEALRKLKENNNKINNNISKDIGVETPAYGNKEINRLIDGINKNLPYKLPQDNRARMVAYNMLQLLEKKGGGKIKKGREFLKDDKFDNVKWFLVDYIEARVSKGYGAESWYKLKDALKLWLVNGGKFPK